MITLKMSRRMLNNIIRQLEFRIENITANHHGYLDEYRPELKRLDRMLAALTSTKGKVKISSTKKH